MKNFVLGNFAGKNFLRGKLSSLKEMKLKTKKFLTFQIFRR